MKNKNFLKKLTAGILGFVMTLGVGAAGYSAAASEVRADSYTITFKTGSGDGTSASTSTACSTVVSDGSDYLSGNLVTATKVYYSGGSGLKLGASSNAGTIKMNLSDRGKVTATSVVVNAKLYNSSKAATLKVNGSATQNLGADFANYTYSITGSITDLELVSSKYCWVKSITINYSSSSKTKEATNVSISGNSSPISNEVIGYSQNLTAKVSYKQGDGYEDGLGNVTWSSSDESVAKVSDSGVVTFLGESNSVTITATAVDKGASGATVSNNVTYSVSNLVGSSSSNPMSVSQALTEANNLSTGENSGYNVFVIGTITGDVTSKSGRYTFDITDSSSTINAYSLNYSGTASVVTGSTVIVKGYLIDYQGKKEVGHVNNTDADSQLVSVAEAASITITGGDKEVNLVYGGSSNTDVKYTTTGTGDLGYEFVAGSGTDCATLTLSNETVTITPKAVGTGDYKLKIGNTLSSNKITVTVSEPHTCTPSDEYEKSETEHWLVCSECGSEIANSRGNHTVDGTDWHTEEDSETHWHICSVCGYHMDAENHTWDDGEVIVEPTKEQPGTKLYTCTKCHGTKEESVPYMNPLDGYYQLVTNVNQLEAYDNVIITNAASGEMNAASEKYKNGSLDVIAVQEENGLIYVARDLEEYSYNAMQFTLEDADSDLYPGKFLFKGNFYNDSSEDATSRISTGYLKSGGSTASSSNNNAYITSYEKGTNDGLYSWTIEIESTGAASVTCQTGGRTHFMYNSQSTLFGCYKSDTQSPVYIYKQVPPTYIESIVFNETLKTLDTNSDAWTPGVTITPDNASSKDYKLEIVSSNPSTGVISVSGKTVTPGSTPGTAVVKAVALDGSDVESSNTCTITISTPRTPLDAPTGFAYSNGNLTWNAVQNASGYKIAIDEGDEQSATSPFDVSNLDLGPHTATLYAVGNSSYSDSESVSTSWDTTPDTISAVSSAITHKVGSTYNLADNVTTTGTGELRFEAPTNSYFTISGSTLTPVAAGGPVTVTAYKGTESCTFTVTITTFDNTTSLNPGIYMMYNLNGSTKNYVSSISGGEAFTNTDKSKALTFNFELVANDTWNVSNTNGYLSIGSSSTSLTYTETAADLDIAWIDQTGGSRSIGNGSRYLSWYSSKNSYRTYTNATGVWLEEVKTYNISFDANGGDGTMSSLQKRDGDSITIPTCSFTAPVQTPTLEFDCWKVTVDASGTLLGNTYKTTDSAFTMPANDITLEAQWVAQRIQLATPTNIQYSNDSLTWDAVENATGYMIKLDDADEFTEISTNSYSVSSLESYSEHSVQIYAISSNELYKDSEIATKAFTTNPKTLPNGNYILVISTAEGYTQYFDSSSYAGNDKTHKATVTNTLETGSGDVLFTSSNVMKQGGGIQFKGGSGYFYNENDLGTIKSISYDKVDSSPNPTITIGSIKEPTSDGTGGYFKIKAASDKTVLDNIIIKFTIGPDTSHTLSYNLNNGSGTLPTSESLTWASPTTLPSGSDLVRTGYTFAGWNTQADGSGTHYNASGSFEMGDLDTVLYAEWIQNEHNVTYNTNGGVYADPSSPILDNNVYHYNDSVTVVYPTTSNLLTKDGYAFGGWSDGTNVYTESDEPTTFNMPDSDVTLTAVWNELYTVHYDAVDGKGITEIEDLKCLAGTPITIGEAPVTYDFTFIGWSDGKNVYQPGDDYVVNGAVTFTAQYIPNALKPAENMNLNADASFYYNHIDESISVSNLKLRFSTELNSEYINADDSTKTYTYGMILVKTSELAEWEMTLSEMFAENDYSPSSIKEFCSSVKKVSWTATPSLNASGNPEFGGTLSFNDLTNETALNTEWTCLMYVYEYDSETGKGTYYVTNEISVSIMDVIQDMLENGDFDANFKEVLEYILSLGGNN